MPISPDLGTTPVHKGDTPLYSGNPNELKMIEIAEKSKTIVNEDLRAQIDNKKDQREHDLAKEYLAKSNTNSGGNNQANEQAVALVNAQPKHDNKNKNDGPGKYKKRN